MVRADGVRRCRRGVFMLGDGTVSILLPCFAHSNWLGAVIPAQAGIQKVLHKPPRILDSCLRGNDAGGCFLWMIQASALLDAALLR